MDIKVLGGGIVGLAAAEELVRRGHGVVVIDRSLPGEAPMGAATERAAGMLAPVAESDWGEREHVVRNLESAQRWPEYAARISSVSGIDVDYRAHGTLVVAVDADDLTAIRHRHQLHRELGLAAELLDGDEARRLEPGLSPSLPGALHCPDDHQVDPVRVRRALAGAVIAGGGEFVEMEVEELEVEDGRVVGARSAGRRLEGPDATWIVAAGAWARKLGLAATPHIRPVRGQMVVVELGDPPLCTRVLRGPNAYLVPKSDGRLLIGATMEEVGFDDRQTAGGVMDLLVGAWEVLPGLHDAPIVQMWSGFRPTSLDNEPVVERSGEHDNVVWAVGHGRNGILLAPWTAQRVADAVEA